MYLRGMFSFGILFDISILASCKRHDVIYPRAAEVPLRNVTNNLSYRIY